MLIDVHTHFVPRHFPDMTGREGGNKWPRIQEINAYKRNIVINGKIFRTVTRSSWNAEDRLKDMEAEGVNVQVVSPIPIALSHWFEPKDTQYFADHVNNEIAELVNKYPGKFYGLGMVPIQSPKLAASELRKIKEEFHLSGVEVGSNINGRSIGDRYFDPFFEAAECEGIAVFIHPIHPIGKDRLTGPKEMQAVVNFPLEIAFAVASLINGGVLERYPNLRIAVSHAGGSFYSLLPRMVHGWENLGPVKETLSQSPETYAKKLFYDGLVYNDQTLKYVVDLYGVNQLMVGSDYPFLIREKEPGKRIDRLGLSGEEKNKIKSENAKRFLGL